VNRQINDIPFQLTVKIKNYNINDLVHVTGFIFLCSVDVFFNSGHSHGYQMCSSSCSFICTRHTSYKNDESKLFL